MQCELRACVRLGGIELSMRPSRGASSGDFSFTFSPLSCWRCSDDSVLDTLQVSATKDTSTLITVTEWRVA